MLKRLVNEARFTLVLQTAGPVLVKSGHASISGPDMTPVRTYRNGDWQPYLPGSSLKGVIRSHIEKVARTLNATPGVVCNPFQRLRREDIREAGQRLLCDSYPHVFCGEKLHVREASDRPPGFSSWQRDTTPLNSETVYAESCPLCRLFGSTSFIGRVSIGDAYLAGNSTVRTELRDGVGIDRLTGGAAHGAKFDLEAVPAGVRFTADVVLRNFECWQLGALLLIVQDLKDGLIRIGSGRSRGLGAVRGWIYEGGESAESGWSHGVEIHYPGLAELPEPSCIWGLGRFLADSTYGTRADDALTIGAQPELRRQGVRLVTAYVGDGLQRLTEAAIAVFSDRTKAWQVPTGMTWEALQWRPAGGRQS
jgi:CRISPR/Cas system CSM-associated protein Csm3 (group 7 of RAMP superfamily)